MTDEYESVLRSDFIEITNLITRPDIFQSPKFNKAPRQIEWNTNAVVECDLVLRKYLFNERGHSITRRLDLEEQTIFSTNKPLLLGSFKCSKISALNRSIHDLRSDLVVDVEITEAIDSSDTNAKIHFKMKSKFGLKQTTISFPYPILCRPGFFISNYNETISR